MCERCLDSRFQRRQITLNQQPETIRIHGVVLVTQPVSQAAYVTPRNSGAEFRCESSKLRRRLADDEQCMLDCEQHLLVFFESVKV